MWSEKGSNKESMEIILFEIVSDYWELVFRDETESLKPLDLFRFVTGSENMPVGGLDSKISVYFTHGCPNGCRCLPVTSLCALHISLPMHLKTIGDVRDAFELAITCSHGLGRL